MHGLFDGKLAVKYAFNADSTDWMASLPDPDAIVRNFMSARECYVIWRNKFGHFFSIITTDPLDTAAGRVMVTVMADSGCMIPGRSVFTALSGLKKTFLEDRILTDDAVVRALQAASIPNEAVELPAWQWHKSSVPAESVQPMCYRTYLSSRELESLFSFPDQPEYERYYYDIIINATSSLRPGIAIDRLTAPVRKVYSVVCPEGVSASADTVEDGKQLTLTFTKEGFSPRKETITAGVPSAYTVYDGSMVKIKSLGGTSMGFVRRIRVNVKNGKGGMVNGYTMSVNDRPVNTMEPFIELTEADLQPGRRVEIQVASNNFQPLVKEYDAAALTRESEIELVLVPVEQGITLRLVFGEGRVFEQQISLEKNTPEYSQLHSGNFHGFRAQKMVTPQGMEVYNVDVRAAGKPVAPTFANVASERTKSRQERVVPQFENITEHARETHTAPVPPAITKETPAPAEPEKKPAEEITHEEHDHDNDPTPVPVEPDDYYTEDDSDDSKTIKRWIVIGSIVVVIALAAFFILPSLLKGATENLPGSGDADATEVVTAENAEAAPEAVPAETAAPAALSADEQADIAYLNSEKIWRQDALKSEKYRALFEMFREGNLAGIAGHDYFAVEGRATNAEAVKIAEMAWGASGSATESSNRRAVQKSVNKDNAISVHDLYEDLARRMPKEPNPQPRPSRKQ